MTGKAVVELILSLGGQKVRQRGSHVQVRCGSCQTTVPVHAGEDLGKRLLRAIERDLEPALGAGWLRRRR
ncbi:MAG: type II toxin-antitoxin system HicA family toxin [Deltaproteobacteria bacterium]|nr:type II toxin-antitoxin system HicA family toxin [Deltaproteobacteria bacterium]